MLHDCSKIHLLSVWEYSVQDLAELCILLLVQNALHLLDLIRVLGQLSQLIIAQTELSIEKLQSQLHHFVLVDCEDGAVNVVFQVKLETSLQNSRHILVTDSLIDLLLCAPQNGIIKDGYISQGF